MQVKCNELFAKIAELYPKYIDVWTRLCSIESPTDCKEGIDEASAYLASVAAEFGCSIERYPQAVAVAKASLLQKDSARIREIVSVIEKSCEWVAKASGEEIVSAVQAHMLDEGQQTSLKAPLLTAQTLSRCGIRFESATAGKAEMQAFIGYLRSVNANAVGELADGFFWDFA